MIYLESIVSRANITKLATVETVTGVMYFNIQKDFLCTNVYNWTCTLHKYNLQIFRPFIFQLGWLENLSIAIFNKE